MVGSGSGGLVGAVEAVGGDPGPDALLEAGEPPVVPHLGGVGVAFDVVEGALPAVGEGGDFGGEAAVFGPAVRDPPVLFGWGVPGVPPRDPGRQNVHVLAGWRLVPAPR